MATKPKAPTHMLGANRKELARRQEKCDASFEQSRDIPEDSGEGQMKVAHPRYNLPNPTRG